PLSPPRPAPNTRPPSSACARPATPSCSSRTKPTSPPTPTARCTSETGRWKQTCSKDRRLSVGRTSSDPRLNDQRPTANDQRLSRRPVSGGDLPQRRFEIHLFRIQG